jgi:hypothetical protein
VGSLLLDGGVLNLEFELIVGKYLTDSEWKVLNRQRMLVIDGKYNNEYGMSTGSL